MTAGRFGAWCEPRPRGLALACAEQPAQATTPHSILTRATNRYYSEPEDKKTNMTHRLVRGVAGATPQGARCVELRLKPQLGVAARSELASPTSSCLPTGRGRRCRSWRSCRLPRRLVPPVPPEPLAARPLVGLACGCDAFQKVLSCATAVVAPVWSLFGRYGFPTLVGEVFGSQSNINCAL